MRTACFDIDTQIDFMYPAGALYVPGAERIVPIVAALNRQAGILVSTTCAHSEDDPEFRDWPAHCVVDTVGQLKPRSTLRANRVVIPPRPAGFDLAGAEQILLEKQQLDLYSNPNLPRLLEALNADEYVVYGVVTEYCVRFAALGLLETGKPVTLLTDAVETLSPQARDRTYREFEAAGGKLATSSKLLPAR
ncbi:MAG TPA: isochorismatase family protein [Bryobacteraceae bacterium]|jgi:nicotinamidase/pyrazinamidase|nr:isochorismatase family protein [Bryobacteraceae bacterium]